MCRQWVVRLKRVWGCGGAVGDWMSVMEGDVSISVAMVIDGEFGRFRWSGHRVRSRCSAWGLGAIGLANVPGSCTCST